MSINKPKQSIQPKLEHLKHFSQHSQTNLEPELVPPTSTQQLEYVSSTQTQLPQVVLAHSFHGYSLTMRYYKP